MTLVQIFGSCSVVLPQSCIQQHSQRLTWAAIKHQALQGHVDLLLDEDKCWWQSSAAEHILSFQPQSPCMRAAWTERKCLQYLFYQSQTHVVEFDHQCVWMMLWFPRAMWMAAHRSSVWHLSLWVCDPVHLHVCVNRGQPGWVKSGR